jgi:hypothetical protein
MIAANRDSRTDARHDKPDTNASAPSARSNPSRHPNRLSHPRSIRMAHTNPTTAASTKISKRTRAAPQRAWRAGGTSSKARTNPRTANRSHPQASHKRIAARGTNEPTLPSCHYSEPHERKRNRHERTDARESHERIAPAVGVAVPVSPWPARRRRRPRSSLPPGCRRQHAAGPWCGRRWRGSPACRRRRRSGPW